MAQSETVATTEAMPVERTQSVLGEEPLLAVALAAALLEYRHHVQQRSLQTGVEGAGENWRLVARFERLRGQG
jgi:hypothetical protein